MIWKVDVKEIPETGNNWQEVESELNAARAARSAGNEGKARVCARRAAGQALRSAGLSSGPPLAAIQLFLDSHLQPEDVRIACSHLLLTVNEEYRLAEGIDLIADAEMILNYLRTSFPTGEAG